jgi:hypothetical protein
VPIVPRCVGAANNALTGCPKYPLMLWNDLRLGDVCGEPIARGKPFRSGWATPAALRDLHEGDPGWWPTYQREPDGTIRFDVCIRCVNESGTLEGLTSEGIDDLC